MPSNSDQAITRVRTAPQTVQLSSWPLRDEPLRTLVIFGLGFLFAVIAAYLSGRVPMGLLVGGLLLPVSWQLWTPIQYELGAKGIVRAIFGWRRRIAWSEFERYETLPHGVFLCHQSNHQPFAAVRGLFLPSQPPHAELLPVLDFYLRNRGSDPNYSTQTQFPV